MDYATYIPPFTGTNNNVHAPQKAQPRWCFFSLGRDHIWDIRFFSKKTDMFGENHGSHKNPPSVSVCVCLCVCFSVVWTVLLKCIATKSDWKPKNNILESDFLYSVYIYVYIYILYMYVYIYIIYVYIFIHIHFTLISLLSRSQVSPGIHVDSPAKSAICKNQHGKV